MPHKWFPYVRKEFDIAMWMDAWVCDSYTSRNYHYGIGSSPIAAIFAWIESFVPEVRNA